MSSLPNNEIKLSVNGVLRGVRKMSAIALFIIPFGVAFGVAAVETGISALEAIIMSIFVFSGVAQFAALDLWSPTTIVSLLLVIFAVSARNVLLGAALSPWVNKLSRPKRLLAMTMLSDPNFADSYNAFKNGEIDIGRLVGGGLILWLAWIFGTLIGTLAGQSFGDLGRFGIDVLMPSYFTALILAQWMGHWDGMNTLLPAIIASIVAVLGLEILPTGWNIVVATLASGIVGGILHGR